jgi:hypothetical protein
MTENYEAEVPEGGAMCNRAPSRTAADVNLDGAPFGFKATGDAAWDTDSEDFAMFTAEGNAAVATMVKTARQMARSTPEADVRGWLDAERARLAADTGAYPLLPHLPDSRSGDGAKTGHDEVRDTMVRETIAYALDEAWVQAYGHRFGED